MPQVRVYNMAGNEVGTMDLCDKIFGADVNGAVLHAAVRAYLLNQRQGTQSTLTRTEVSGGGKKPCLWLSRYALTAAWRTAPFTSAPKILSHRSIVPTSLPDMLYTFTCGIV